MPEWLLQLVVPAISGASTGLVIIAGLRVEVRNLKESNGRAHVRIDDHIDWHINRKRPEEEDH